MYLGVTENNSEPAPLFDEVPGTGSPDVVGNQISFNPQGFSSQSSGGAADLVDSTMTTIIMAKPGKAIDSIVIDEFGDYTLSGLAGGLAEATVGAGFFVTVLEIDNVPVGGIPTKTANMQFASGSGPNGGEYARPGDDGTTVTWQGTAFIDVVNYLNSLNIDGSATKVRLRFDNTLTTAADAVSNAFIKKKEVGGVIITVDTNNIPEPSTIVLAALAGLGMVVARRRAVC
jgi:hypothetical protein